VTLAADVAGRALGAVEGDDAQAVVLAERSGLARFAGSEVHQPTLIENLVVTVLVARDGRVGLASTNRTGDEELTALARRAAEAAATAGGKADFPGFPPPSRVPAVAGFDPETAGLSPEEQARLAGAAIGARNGLGVYGFFTSGVTDLAIASSTGVAVEQSMTDATALVVAAGADRSGYAERTAFAAGRIDPAEVAEEAVEKAERTRGATELEPGSYRALLEPYALAELLQYLAYDSFGALGLLEERSYLAGRLGERVFDEQVSIADDALDPRGLPKAFDFEGTPKRRVELVEDGVARGVVWDRATAARAEEERSTTGHAPPPLLRDYGPLPFALSMRGGEAASVEELVALVGDGIYVTRLHYLGVVHPREGVVTGMTRDGTFRVRDGRVAEPLVNLRITVSVPDLLREVLGLTREVSLVNASDFYGERYPARARDGTLQHHRHGLRAGALASRRRYESRWKSRTVLAKKIAATTTVSRVRLRSTMCVPPWDWGVKPIPPSPASRPECMSTRPIRAIETRTWKTAATASTAVQGSEAAGPVATLTAGDLHDRVDELGRDPVLRDVARGAGLASPVHVRAGVRARQHQHAGVGERLADAPGRLEAVHDGHADVHQRHVGTEGGRQLDRLPAVACVPDNDDAVVAGENRLERLREEAVIIGDENADGVRENGGGFHGPRR
jgi:predicted Zn-dependent protease